VNYSTDSDYGDSVVQTVSRARPKAFWNAHNLGRCDVARLQARYDMTSWAALYSTCLDLGITLTLAASSTSIPTYTTITFTARLLVADNADDGRLTGNPISGRRVTLQRRTPGTTTWTSMGTMSATATAGTYAMTQSPTATYEWRAVFAKPSNEGLRGGTSAAVKVSVVTCSSSSCPQSGADDGRRGRHRGLEMTAMRATRAAVLVAVSTFVAGACSAGMGASPQIPPSPVPAVRTPVRATATTSPGSTVGAAPATNPTASTSPREATIAPPPPATIVVEGREYVGTVGGFAWSGGSDAAPWLPAAVLPPVEVPARTVLNVVARGAPAIEAWVARSAPAIDATGAASATGLGEGTGLPTFRVPPDPDSVVAVELHFAGGGDGVWYWHLVVR
jgi:hypothetical protein